jgi:ABC-type multidrug transport system fused ATPase/permease subunit
MASADRIFEVMSLPSESDALADAANTAPVRLIAPPPVKKKPALPPAAPAVRFENVTLCYDGGQAALKEFSLDVAPGEMMALVGRSGAGKTTVTNLLLRYYPPTSGRILVDGRPIEELPLAELRQQIGLVQQDIFLFSGSVLDNIAYARPGAKPEDVFEAARAANAHDFIQQLPKGYETEVGERGVKLSGGQRQRLAIARALLRDPRILIFDEATSHLDSESEALVQAALDRVARGRTVFVIAHRLSTIDRADRIVVIDDGAIMQVGKHEELLKESPVYRRLYGLQAGRDPAMVHRREEKRLLG